MGELAKLMGENRKLSVLLKKPSATIAIKADLSAVQRKFYNALLFKAKTELKKNESGKLKNVFTISLTDLKSLLKDGAAHNNSYYMNELKKLLDKKVEYNILHKDYESYTIANLVSALKIVSRKNDREKVVIKFELPVTILEILADPRGFFANIDLKVMKELDSKYSTILYELCKDYENVEIPKMTIEKFKEMFNLAGKKSYERIDHVKTWVLDPAIKELNENPKIDFLVSYKLYKTGKRYTHIKFIVKPKPQKLKLSQQAEFVMNMNNSDLQELVALVPEKYRTKKTCLSLLLGALKEKSKEYVKSQILYINESKNVKRYCSLLKKAIEQDYACFDEFADVITGEDTSWKNKVIGKRVVFKDGTIWTVAHIKDREEKDDGTVRYLVGFKYDKGANKEKEVKTEEKWMYISEETLKKWVD